MEDEGADLLHEAAWQVYAVPPEEFVSTRTAWVKRLRGEGHRDLAKTVGTLRKPSVSAAAINGLVRADEPVVQQLRDVGDRLRHAQSALDAAGLAALRGERDDVLAAWVEAAQAHSPSGALTAAVEAEVRSTAVAALADAQATDVVLSGTLTRALSYSGFGEVDVADAVARTSTGVMLTRIEGGRAAQPAEDAAAPEHTEDGIEDDEDDEDVDDDEDDEDEEVAEDDTDDELDGALEHVQEDLDQAETDVSDARARRREALSVEKQTLARVTEAEQAVEQARQLLAEAERHLAEATHAHDEAAAELTEADTALTEARERRDTAREALEEAEDA